MSRRLYCSFRRTDCHVSLEMWQTKLVKITYRGKPHIREDLLLESDSTLQRLWPSLISVSNVRSETAEVVQQAGVQQAVLQLCGCSRWGFKV